MHTCNAYIHQKFVSIMQYNIILLIDEHYDANVPVERYIDRARFNVPPNTL